MRTERRERPVPTQATRALRPQADGAFRRMLPDLPGWPVVLVLAGTPLWWLSGLTPFVPALFVLLAAGLIMIAPRVSIVPGVMPFLLFALWCLPSTLMLDTPMRLVAFGMRWMVIVGAALMLILITNSQVRDDTVLKAIFVVWVLVIVGGYLGMLLPNGGFTTPLARFLPASLLENELVGNLMTPKFAEVQQPWGAPAPFNRPSAPFPYTNGWGCAIGLLTPLMLGLRDRLTSRVQRALIPVGIVVSAVPAMATRNRGMLIILVVAVAATCFTLLVRGKVGYFARLAGLLVVGFVGFVAVGGWAAIVERQQYSDTTTGRASIYEATFTMVMQSPLIGWGGPRPNEEIGIALGTQGAMWMYLFSYGFLGLALFWLFLIGVVVRHYPPQDTTEIWMHSTVVAGLVGSAFYGFDFTNLSLIVVPAALLLRSGHRRRLASAAR